VGTLYVVGVPARDPDDLTLRALRVLGEVDLVAAADVPSARHLLAHHDISTPLVAVTCRDDLLAALETGDVALFSEGRGSGPSGPNLALIRAAIERGFPVVPVPGPDLALTALVIAGLPADSFVCLGDLPAQTPARRNLLASLANERRTLVALESPARLPAALADLRDALGDRPLVVVAAAEQGVGTIWQGTVAEAPECPFDRSLQAPWVLVVGGARECVTRWDEERLRAGIRSSLEQGLGAREIGRQLASESGWRRREIYRLAVEIARFPPDE